MKAKKLISVIVISTCIAIMTIYFLNRKERYITSFLANVKSNNLRDTKGVYVDTLNIGDQLIYYASAEACGNEKDGFDLCLVLLPDKTLMIEDKKHYCGIESTGGLLRRSNAENITDFMDYLLEQGFKKSL